MRRATTVPAAALAFLLAGACGSPTTTSGSSTSVAPATATTPSLDTDAPGTGAPGTAVPGTSRPRTSVRPPAGAGPLTITASAVGPAAFGSSTDEVRQALAPVLGPPTADHKESGECGSGVNRALEWPGLTLWFDGDHLAGYHHRAAPGRTVVLRTPAGITLGSTAAELRAAYGVTAATSTLGDEWFVTSGAGEGLGGFLSGPGGDATVTGIYAGSTCFFR